MTFTLEKLPKLNHRFIAELKGEKTCFQAESLFLPLAFKHT